jgi:hypothetical protein
MHTYTCTRTHIHPYIHMHTHIHIHIRTVVVFPGSPLLPLTLTLPVVTLGACIFADTLQGPRMVRDVFRLARENAPSIIFIDEVDAIGTKRFDSQTGADREVQRILLELLTQMDGFDQHTNVKVIMATNRHDTLDPALLRPGRLDRKVWRHRVSSCLLIHMHLKPAPVPPATLRVRERDLLLCRLCRPDRVPQPRPSSEASHLPGVHSQDELV